LNWLLEEEPKPRKVVPVEPFEHPDAKRRFRVINNVDELAARWNIRGTNGQFFFISTTKVDREELRRTSTRRRFGWHRKNYRRVASRCLLSTQNPDARVLLATFSETLTNALRMLLRRLINSEPRLGERIDVHSIR
jgi:hypothetical protein